jgi:hypothetical protein
MRLQKYRPRSALMPPIEQPLTQIHFIPPQLFLVSVGDMTYGRSNVVISVASSTPFSRRRPA